MIRPLLLTRDDLMTPRGSRPPSWRFGGAALLLLLLVGCAPKAPVQPRFFWPSPLEPKIEYVNFYYTDQDVRRGMVGMLEDSILGRPVAHRVFDRPLAIAADGKGRVFVSDVSLGKVFVFDLPGHKIRSLQSAGGGTYALRFASGIDVDEATGETYVLDAVTQSVHLFGPDEKGREVWELSEVERPTGLAVDPQRKRFYIADAGSHRVFVFAFGGELLQVIGRRGTGEAEFNYPVDLDLDADGNLYVLDVMNARVQVLSPDGRFLRAFGERGTALGSFRLPKAIAVSRAGQVYVTDSQSHRFVIFDLEGRFLLTIGGKHQALGESVVPGGFYLPEGIDVDGQGGIWVVDSLNRMFHHFQYVTPEYLEQNPILPEQVAPPAAPVQGSSGSSGR